ncbi:MAG TPA: DNA-3-methyladenine glycosylase [Candidatus Paceibacterota bacterium]|nr:DNA-3-methyladenine glycosylase [Candidatus Paceibacterota bacterium]
MSTAHHKKIAHLKKNDPRLKTVIEGVKLKELAITRGPFESLVEAIVSQQLSVKAADTIFARFIALTPGRKFPTPREILAMPVAKMRKCGLSRMKVSFIKDLARKTLDGTLDFKHMDAMSDAEIVEHLVRVKGIGQWTAEMFLIFSLGRDDVFSYGDLGLRNAMKKIYKMKAAPTSAQAEKITAKWKPYRSLGSRYLWASLKNK